MEQYLLFTFHKNISTFRTPDCDRGLYSETSPPFSARTGRQMATCAPRRERWPASPLSVSFSKFHCDGSLGSPLRSQFADSCVATRFVTVEDKKELASICHASFPGFVYKHTKWLPVSDYFRVIGDLTAAV